MFTHIFLIENKIIQKQHFVSLFDYIESISNTYFDGATIRGTIDVLFSSGEKSTFRSNNKDELCQFIHELSTFQGNQINMHFNIGDEFKIIHLLNTTSKMYQSKNNFLEVSSTNVNATESFKATFEEHLSRIPPKKSILNKIGLLTRSIVIIEILFLAIIGFGLLLERLNINSFISFQAFIDYLPLILVIFIGIIIVLNLTFNIIFHLIIPTSISFDFTNKKT